ncbi:MAG: glycosyltransferase family 2 protein, partial [Bacteroidetes bacterium]|nr:glycosyltransferase family 2 protein [Bacteroidota bacterium]
GENNRTIGFPSISFSHLLWRFIFQLGVWADLRKTQTHFLFSPFLSLLKAFYRRRGNTFTFAGWPLVTQVSDPWFKTALSGLGCAIVKRDWLIDSPFDETLDPSGIGDNYGVAIRFPGKKPIAILTTAHVLHHKSSLNRPSAAVAYFRRILALDYFMSRSQRFHSFQRIVLCWSLVGNFLAQTMIAEIRMARATLRALRIILQNRNPYTRGFVKGEKNSISPELTWHREE